MILPTFEQLTGTLADPAARHAAVVHAPVIAAATLPVLAVLPFFVKAKWPRFTLLGAAILTAGLAWVAVLTGEAAYGEMGALPESVRELAHAHEEMGEKLWYFALVVAAAAFVQILKNPLAATTGKVLAPLASIAAISWTVFVAHHGGTLVYEFGVGTPNPVTQAQLTPPAEGEMPIVTDARLTLFREDVKPFFEARCYGCHYSPNAQPGWLDMSTYDGIQRGGERGPAVIAGDPENSPIYRAMKYHEPSRMPPDGSLATAEELNAVYNWIEQGAIWE